MNYISPFILLIAISLNTMAQTLDKQQPVKMLALGDSYTICESVDPMYRWPVQLIKELRLRGFNCSSPQIIATTGWRTDDLKGAILAENPDNDFNLVSLLIGVNNQYQGKSAASYEPEFEELLQMAISFAGGDQSKVFVVSIPDYGFTPFGKAKQESISKAIDEFNEVNRRVAAKYNVAYFYITDITREGLKDPSLVASDELHPSAKMYAMWVDRILPKLLE